LHHPAKDVLDCTYQASCNNRRYNIKNSTTCQVEQFKSNHMVATTRALRMKRFIQARLRQVAQKARSVV